ncbi:LysR family transcriptional regulator ArgP [Arthrobacter rhombi]|uniref:LysR family transcriptional regulator ArgP n=1 Tax=Arthrobacter rhombi TaxID=71253 RepID=UPI003FD2AD82
MDFPADQLRAFAAVIDTGTFDAAASRLQVTPSAVSQRIKALETQVGTVLIRRGKPAQPTTAGTVLLRLARQVDLLAAEAMAELSGGGIPDHEMAPERAAVSVVVNADSLATWFPGTFTLLAQDARLELEVLRADESVSAELLRSGAAMAAVTTDGRAVQGCTTEILGTLRYTAMASPAFRKQWFAGDPASGLAVAPMVDFDRSDQLQRSQLRSICGSQVRPPTHYVPDSAQFVRAVVDGLGWGMVPDAQDPGQDSLVVLDPGWIQDVALYWQRWKLDSPALGRVSDAVRAAARGSGLLELTSV